MKYVLICILVLIVGMLGYGYYIKEQGDFNGEIIIGIGVLIIAFVLMPLFIYHRYKNKDLKNFKITNFTKKEEKEDKEEE